MTNLTPDELGALQDLARDELEIAISDCGACGGWHAPGACDLDYDDEILHLAGNGEGWAIFETHGSTAYGPWQIQRDDDEAVFADDTEVWRHVYVRAINGDPICLRALEFIRRENPLEHRNIVAYNITAPGFVTRGPQ